jgi:hypothetical protein
VAVLLSARTLDQHLALALSFRAKAKSKSLFCISLIEIATWRGMLQSIARHIPRARTPVPHQFSTTNMSTSNLLIYLMRRDLRLDDNPILHELAQQKNAPFTHLLPVYVFAAQQVEVSGFIPKDCGQNSPYPEARSEVGGFWRCGPHRAKFLAESVWDLKETLEGVGSGLELRVGMVGEVIKGLLEGLATEQNNGTTIGGVWMASEEGVEEKTEEMDVRRACREADVQFKLWTDEKYFIDEYVPFDNRMIKRLAGLSRLFLYLNKRLTLLQSRSSF